MVRVAVLGADGRMGAEVCRAVQQDPELDLVARIEVNDSLDVLTDAGAEVAVDFTTPSAVKENVRGCLARNVHVVVGTTGMNDKDLEEVAGWARESEANAFVAPNFAIGAVLMMKFAAQAAPWFDYGEIIERHHERKLDAPSGTALRTAALMADARSEPFAPAPDAESLPGSRGGSSRGVRVHSMRMSGSVAHQEVWLGAPGQTLSIRHDSLDRSSFMPGVVLGIKTVASLGGLVVGLENVLEL